MFNINTTMNMNQRILGLIAQTQHDPRLQAVTIKLMQARSVLQIMPEIEPSLTPILDELEDILNQTRTLND